MSDRSRKLAAYVRQFKEKQPIQDEAAIIRNKILDDGFRRLRDQLDCELEKQVSELNEEPDCANTLVSDFSVDSCSVQRTDDPESKLAVKFDFTRRTVAISCDKPTKFRCFVDVQLTANETGSYLRQGKSSKDMGPLPEDQIGWLVEKAIYALFGIGA